MLQIYPWQQNEWQQLIKQYQNDRLPHGLLLNGPRGIGKKQLALTFSQWILCEAKKDQACGYCRGCQLFQSNHHPDFFLIEPEEDKFIRVEGIRDLIHQLNQTSQQSGYQVVVIVPAEKMNRAAANAFLKTLEEPAGSVLIILVCHELSALMPTIVSRCQRLTLATPTLEQSLSWLRVKIPNENDIKKLLKVSDGSPLQALARNESEYLSLRKFIFTHLSRIIKSQTNPLDVANELAEKNMVDVLAIIVSILNDLLRCQLEVDERYFINSDYFDELNQFSSYFSKKMLLSLLLQYEEIQRLNSSAVSINKTLLLESLFLSWSPSCVN